MALGHVDADRADLVQQARHRHLALVMLRQHEAAQSRAEVPRHLGRQRRCHGRAVRCQPPLTAVAHRVNPQHEILHHEADHAFS